MSSFFYLHFLHLLQVITGEEGNWDGASHSPGRLPFGLSREKN